MTKILLGLALLLAILHIVISTGSPNGLTVLVMLVAMTAVLHWYRSEES